MAIDMANYIQSVKENLYDFLAGYFTVALEKDAKISIVSEKIVTPMEKPIVRILPMPGSSTRGTGAGKKISDNPTTERMAVYKDLVFAILVTTDEHTGSEMKRDEYSGYLEKIILEHRDELGTRGLRKAEITPPSPLLIDDALCENYHTFSCEVLFYVDKARV